ncbi:MAG TPA: cationic amino acid transporter [Balneolaceae bacterium]|nr:cationic amino acid transporter [Balneolaceae bacterium]
MNITSPTSEEQKEKLPRRIGLWGLWMLVVNGLIGAGIFGLPGGAAALAGEYSVLMYAVAAILILPIILSFAELGSYYQGTGGPIRYGTEAFGSFVGFQSGWLYYMARVISFSANSVLLVDSIGYFFDPITEGAGRILSLAIICVSLTLINILGTVESIRSLALFTLLKFGVLVILVIGGFVYLGTTVIPAFDQPIPAGSDIGAAVVLLIYAFVGFEGGIVPAGETKEPHRNMPKAFILGLVSVTILYMFIQTVAQGLVPDLADSEAPLLEAASVLFGEVGSVILMGGIVASVTGNLVSNLFATPRITYALSIEKALPTWFGKVHPAFLTPANSILFFGGFAFLGAVFGSFTFLAAMTVLSRALLYLISCASIPVLRPRYQEKDIFILKGGYVIPVLGIIACIWLLFQVSFTSLWMTLVFIAVGSILYLAGRSSVLKIQD